MTTAILASLSKVKYYLDNGLIGVSIKTLKTRKEPNGDFIIEMHNVKKL